MDFTLEKWAEAYAPHVAEYADNPKIACNLRDGFPSPYTLRDAEDFIRAFMAAEERLQCVRAIAAGGKAIGSIGVFLKDDVYRKSAEIGYWLGEPFWGKGIMSSAIRQISDYAFEQYDIVRIFAEPFADNAGSRKALEKAGFQLEGILQKSVYKNGVFHDSCMYARIR